jgi:hypothetical protein
MRRALVSARRCAGCVGDCELSIFFCDTLKDCGRVAQLVEQCPFKAWVAGSNPAALTTRFSGTSTQFFVAFFSTALNACGDFVGTAALPPASAPLATGPGHLPTVASERSFSERFRVSPGSAPGQWNAAQHHCQPCSTAPQNLNFFGPSISYRQGGGPIPSNVPTAPAGK